MENWSLTTWCIVTVVGPAALYALHRFCLRLERAGLIYYLHTKPRGGAARSFVALQQALEPQVQHVFHIKEEKRHYAEEDESDGRDPAAPPATDSEGRAAEDPD